MFRLTCGGGSASWVDFGSFWRQLDIGFDPGRVVLVTSTLSVLALVAIGGGVIWVCATAIERWRSRPVPQLDNPILEGATRDLAQAVELLRADLRATDLLARAGQKIARCTGRLSKKEQRVLSDAWAIVERASPGA